MVGGNHYHPRFNRARAARQNGSSTLPSLFPESILRSHSGPSRSIEASPLWDRGCLEASRRGYVCPPHLFRDRILATHYRPWFSIHSSKASTFEKLDTIVVSSSDHAYTAQPISSCVQASLIRTSPKSNETVPAVPLFIRIRVLSFSHLVRSLQLVKVNQSSNAEVCWKCHIHTLLFF